jgi:hypothetical protein
LAEIKKSQKIAARDYFSLPGGILFMDDLILNRHRLTCGRYRLKKIYA